ncbi:MAG TPA: FG-GAP-like repeat-containing protein [Urbifossiella sp.]|jgi:hypothetical protein|nr:FG-GAP-like repeat-containing protein [Urbifossiella sp.]
MPPPTRRTRLAFERLDDRIMPAFMTGSEVVVGTDAGVPAVVRLLDPATGAVQDTIEPFGSGFTGGVRVAVGDVTGDGYPDLVCAAGPGGGPAVAVYDGKVGRVASFFAFDPSFRGGVNVAVGDVTGGGTGEIVVGAGPGGGPAVGVFDAAGNNLRSFFAYDPGFHGGVNVAAGDVTGDGRAEVVTAPQSGGGPNVRVFDPAAGFTGPQSSFFAYAPDFTGGVAVAVADVDGDGRAEVVTGAGPGGAPAVGVFRGDGGEEDAFYAFAADFRGGVRVGAADLVGDGASVVLAAAGPGGGSEVNAYRGGDELASSFFAFPADQRTGFYLAGSPDALTFDPALYDVYSGSIPNPGGVDNTPNAPTGYGYDGTSGDQTGDTSNVFDY